MAQEKMENDILDRVLQDALSSNDDLLIPQGLVDKAIQKLEKKFLLRELILELCIKFGIAIGSLFVLVGVFTLIKGGALLSNAFGYFVNNWQVIMSLLLLGLITILIDQIVLRFYNENKKAVRL